MLQWTSECSVWSWKPLKWRNWEKQLSNVIQGRVLRVKSSSDCSYIDIRFVFAIFALYFTTLTSISVIRKLFRWCMEVCWFCSVSEIQETGFPLCVPGQQNKLNLSFCIQFRSHNSAIHMFSSFFLIWLQSCTAMLWRTASTQIPFFLMNPTKPLKPIQNGVFFQD